MRTHVSALLVLVLLLVGCGSGASPTPTQASPRSTAPAGPSVAVPTPTPAPSLVDGATASFMVDCGPLGGDVATCLAIVAAAATSGLGVEHPPVISVTVRTGEPTATSAPSPSLAPSGSPAVEIETFVYVYSVGFSWTGGREVVPVSQVYAGWLPGLPLAATRTYRVSDATPSWTEPEPFAIKTGAYRIDGACSGSDSTPGGAMVVLQRVRTDGTVLADVHRVHCGPVELTAIFGDTVTLDEGLYRLAIEENTGGLDVRMEPAATTSS